MAWSRTAELPVLPAGTAVAVPPLRFGDNAPQGLAEMARTRPCETESDGAVEPARKTARSKVGNAWRMADSGVRIVAIEGRSALVDYRAGPSRG